MRKLSSFANQTTIEGGNGKDIEILDERVNELRMKLNDVYYSSYLKSKKINDIKMKGFSNKGQTITPKHIILPLSSHKVIWDLFMASLIVVQSLLIPLDFGFNKECLIDVNGLYVLKVFQIINYVLFSFDILFNFFTALENEKAEYDFNLRNIAIHYFRTLFAVDVAANVPFEYIFTFDTSYCWTPSFSATKALLIFRFLRIIRLIKINEIIEKYTPAKLISLARLVKIVLFYFFIINIIGILFTANSITLLNKIDQSTKDSKTMSSFLRIYIYSIFVGIYLVLGSDMAYESSSEKSMISIINIVALITNANVFGSVAVTLKNSQLGGGDDSNLERIESINDFLNYQHINNRLKMDIKNYYLLMYKRQRDLFNRTNIFGDLSNSLKIISKFEYWKSNYFSYDTLFINNSSEFMADSLLFMKAKMFIANERILYEGESTTDFYLIPSGGKCAVIIQGITVKILKEGEYFGETAIFLTSEKRSASVDSLNLSDLLYIQGQDFLTLLRNHTEESEFLKSVAMSNFYGTIALTRISLATQLFPKRTSQPLFKSNLYEDNDDGLTEAYL